MSKFDEAIQLMMKKRDQVIKKVALFVEGQSKANAPVKTGELRRRITHATETDEKESRARIGTNLEYAAAVEYGTSKMKAQPYLRPAIEHNLDQIKGIIHKELKL
ncbi:HK97-gp10 family putative phage morphogenesis protein [Ammoniphilus resinae]|uniref:HK97 gp10 family phage protein n=1 Tax=Ammoniphilus resinae TaxID=861532 RepID=A0ABS4GXV0_9BACL|nr:HK97-gp10 family putative phage morphogenesis protein [Ammoniphilus resinae]MBP1935101.1 HK97 gp10 family phage protein [Ammoniphilus resinae]